MKVKDLIKKLEQFDQELDIMTVREKNYYLEDFNCDLSLSKIVKKINEIDNIVKIEEGFDYLYEKDWIIKQGVIIETY